MSGALFQAFPTRDYLHLPTSVMLVTCDTSQPGIAPYSLDEHIPSTATAALLLGPKHVAMAALKLASVMGVGGLGGGPGRRVIDNKHATEIRA